MEQHDLQRERRKQRSLERLGTNCPRCATCGETDWRCFEAHHVAGRRRDATTAVLCANCHRKVTDEQQDHPTPVEAGDEQMERIGHFLLGLADMLRLIVERLIAFGEALIKRAQPQAQASS